MEPDWARDVRDQCLRTGVPFFFKQWGGVNKKITGRILDDRTWNEMPASVVVRKAAAHEGRTSDDLGG
jgi:protein gp37